MASLRVRLAGYLALLEGGSREAISKKLGYGRSALHPASPRLQHRYDQQQRGHRCDLFRLPGSSERRKT